MKKMLLALALALGLAALSSCSSGKSPSSASTAGSSAPATALGDVYATVYINNSSGPFTGGMVTLDGGSPVTLDFNSRGRVINVVKLYSNIVRGTHTIAYSDSHGTTLSCAIDFGGGIQVEALSLCYSLGSSGPVASGATCGYSVYYSCP